MAKKISAVFAVLTLLVFPVMSVKPVHAQNKNSSCSVSDIILSGLFAGANFDFSNSGCNDQKTTNSSNSSSVTTPAPATSYSGLYIALGDSVAAGLGLPAPTNLMNNDKVCGISPQAYPSLVANRVGMSYINAACSGATAGDMVTEQHLANTSQNIEPQLDTAFAYGTPGLITITAGANDAHWADFIRKCYIATCGTSFDQEASAILIKTMQLKLAWSLSEIERRSDNKPPRVVLTGYYNPVSANCANITSNLTNAEIEWLNSEVGSLNAALQQTVSVYRFATFVPVNFQGHELCTSSPWVQNTSAAAPFHPTAIGQQKIAESVLSSIGK